MGNTIPGSADEALVELRNRASLFEASAAEKLRRMPLRLLHTKAMERICNWTGACRKTRVRTFWGDPMIVVFPEKVSVSIARYRFFEEGLTATVLKCLKPGMTFFDVGSHFGYFSLLASWIVGKGGQVHAFEPTPSTFGLLSENVGDRPNVRVNNVAAFSSESTLDLTDYGLAFSAFNTVRDGKLAESAKAGLAPRKHSVRAVALDQYTTETGARPDFIKIDAEGAELDILLGMERTLAECQPSISLEVGDAGSTGESSSRQALQHLLSRGYEAWQYQGGRLVRHQLQKRYRYDNILMAPPGRIVE